MAEHSDPVSVDVLTLRLLEQIRNEMRGIRDEIRDARVDLGARIDQNGTRIDQNGTRIDTLRAELGSRLQFLEHGMVELAPRVSGPSTT